MSPKLYKPNLHYIIVGMKRDFLILFHLLTRTPRDMRSRGKGLMAQQLAHLSFSSPFPVINDKTTFINANTCLNNAKIGIVFFC